jgi:hypothetical protein
MFADEPSLVSGQMLQTGGLFSKGGPKTGGPLKIAGLFSGGLFSGQGGRNLGWPFSEAALWRKYQRLRAQSKGPDPIGRQRGIGATDFERLLTGTWATRAFGRRAVTSPAHK